MKKYYIAKNLLITSLLIFVLCINCFAVTVSDNDGSAFITKPEFDSLKNSFQTQINNYNTKIDSKIDGAIAAYLAGITLEKKSVVTMDDSFEWTFPIICMNGSEWNDTTSKYYDYELPNIKDVELQLRGYGNNGTASSWMNTSPLYANNSNKATGGAICLQKGWFEIPEKYNELINISDNYRTKQIGNTSYRVYEIANVGKGRHVTEDYTVSAAKDAGHIGTTRTYWGYTGIIGIGVSGANGIRDTMTTSTFANWSTSKWTRTEGDGLASIIGWGGQTTRAFVLPSNDLNLNGARTWASNYTGFIDRWHGQGKVKASADSSSRINSFAWKNNNNNIRQWVYTGNSDAPATSVYGWCFDMIKPQSATEKFEGYIMWYMNDIGMAATSDGTWYGFHSWVPHWFWRFKAAGSIGTTPSSSQFSKLPAKQICYYDNNNNMHSLDEGLFLLNLKKSASTVDFNAIWETIDTSLPSGQKIKLKISSTPFDSYHDSSNNLKYKVNKGNAAADQEVEVGKTLAITVECNDSVRQLYMMWEPVTNGAYLGLSAISNFTVTTDG